MNLGYVLFRLNRKYKGSFHISSILVVKDSFIIVRSVSVLLEKYDPEPLAIFKITSFFCERMNEIFTFFPPKKKSIYV